MRQACKLQGHEISWKCPLLEMPCPCGAPDNTSARLLTQALLNHSRSSPGSGADQQGLNRDLQLVSAFAQNSSAIC